VRFLYCAKLSKNSPTGQYTQENFANEEILQDPGGGRGRPDPEKVGKSNVFAFLGLAPAIETNGLAKLSNRKKMIRRWGRVNQGVIHGPSPLGAHRQLDNENSGLVIFTKH